MMIFLECMVVVVEYRMVSLSYLCVLCTSNPGCNRLSVHRKLDLNVAKDGQGLWVQIFSKFDLKSSHNGRLKMFN